MSRTSQAGPFFVVGLDVTSTSQEALAQLASSVPVMDSLTSLARESGAMLLRTCNRVELYGVAPAARRGEIRDAFIRLVREAGLSPESTYLLHCRKSVGHLAEVCAGLRSLLVGETAIRAQAKQAYAQIKDRVAHPLFHRSIQRAFQLARWVTSEARYPSTPTGIEFRVLDRLGDPQASGNTLLLVGTGQLATDFAREAHLRGWRLTLTGRSLERALDIAECVGGHAVDLDSLSEILATMPIAVFASGGGTLVDASAVATPAGSIWVDLAVPGNVVGESPRIQLWHLEELCMLSREHREAMQSEQERLRAMLRDRLENQGLRHTSAA